MSKVIAFPDMTEKKKEKFDLDTSPKNRSIELPKYLWDLLDKEAEECGRSAVKQLRQILFYYFELDSPEAHQARAVRARAYTGSPQETKRKAS